MKIIVSNEEEKKVLEAFIALLQEGEGFVALELHENEYEREGYVRMLSYEDLTLLRDNVYSGTIVIDKNEPEMYFDDSDILTGTCKICGINTTGLMDGESLSYSCYKEYTSDEGRKNWKCEVCISREEG